MKSSYLFLSFFVLPIALTGCASARLEAMIEAAQQKGRTPRCTELAFKQNRPKEWLDLCIDGNQNTLIEGQKAELMSQDDQTICRSWLINYENPLGLLAKTVSQEKFINCTPFIPDIMKDYFTNAPVEPLCDLWYYRNTHPDALPFIDKIKETRKIDCVQVIASKNQTLAMRSQAAAMQDQAKAMDWIARATENSKNVTCRDMGFGTISCH